MKDKDDNMKAQKLCPVKKNSYFAFLFEFSINLDKHIFP